MGSITDNYKISAKIYVDNQYEIKDLKAVNDSQVGADNPGSLNQEPLKWEKEEKDGLVRIKSVDFKDHYLGAVTDGSTCKAVLGKEYCNTWFEKVEDSTSKEYFILISDRKHACHNPLVTMYLTLGVAVRGTTPITFEKEKPKPKRTEQKWKFTRVAVHHVTDKSAY